MFINFYEIPGVRWHFILESLISLARWWELHNSLFLSSGISSSPCLGLCISCRKFCFWLGSLRYLHLGESHLVPDRLQQFPECQSGRSGDRITEENELCLSLSLSPSPGCCDISYNPPWHFCQYNYVEQQQNPINYLYFAIISMIMPECQNTKMPKTTNTNNTETRLISS